MDVRERLAGDAAERVQTVVRAALGASDATVVRWELAPLFEGSGTHAVNSSLYRLSGAARVGTVEQPWRLVLKVVAPVAGQDDPAHMFYGKREMLLYRSGALDTLPAGLGAPRCYGCDEQADTTVWLWLEHIREDGERAWPIAGWALAARHLGQFNGAFLDGRPLPRAPWLSGRRLRTWLERHGQLVAQIEAAPLNPSLRQWWPRSVVAGILRLWEERHAFCDALERMPQTFCHGDAIRRNLFARRRVDGGQDTVGIDWEHAGFYAVGEEVGQTLSVASAFFDVEPGNLPELDEALFAGYHAGLCEAGWHGDLRQVRFAYAAHAALRNAFNAVGASQPDEARHAAAVHRFGHTWEELAERRAAVRPFLLELAQEARTLLNVW